MIRLDRRPTAWPDALARLKQADLEKIKRTFPGYPYSNLLWAIDVSVEGLEPTDQERYLDMAVFHEDVPIPEEPLRILWNTEEIDTRDCMKNLVARSLATWATDGTSLILHDIQRDLIHKRRERDLPELHGRLVNGWGDLTELPDAYAWRWVAYHLVEAGRIDDLYTLVLDEVFRKAQCEKLAQIQPTLESLQMALNIALARDDLIKVLYCVGVYRETIGDASIAESIFKAVEAGDCDQALQHTDLYGTASEWTHVLRLYLALEAAESKNVAAARRAVMATAQVSLVQASVVSLKCL
jgi:hypothetical protein